MRNQYFFRAFVILMVLFGFWTLSFSSDLKAMLFNELSPLETTVQGEGLHTVYLPMIVKPFAVNSTLDAVDANPGDGRCETASGNNICTLRAIIQETNALPGTNTILIPAGTYRLTIVGDSEDQAATGDLDITDKLIIVGAGAAVTVVDGNRLDRVFHSVGATITVSGITVTNGEAKGFDGGGGIFVGAVDYSPGSLTLINSIISHNLAPQSGPGFPNYSGGGILSNGALTITGTLIENNESTHAHGGGVYAGTTFIRDSIIRNNVAGLYGGGIAAGSLTLISSVVESNSLYENTYASNGGGINVYSTSTIEDSVIRNNSLIEGKGAGLFIGGNATVSIVRTLISGNTTVSPFGYTGTNGGGIYSESYGTITIVDSQITGNFAESQGGGIFNRPTFLSGSISIQRTTISENVAEDRGGGIYNDWVMTLENVTLSGNRADGMASQLGGAIAQSGSSLTILNGTIYGNEANYGGGILVEEGFVAIKNTILLSNTAALDPFTNNCGGGVISLGYNLENGTDCNLAAVGDLSQTIALLGPLQMNGGHTPTHALLPLSPAIDSGTNDQCPASDQRGAARPIDGNGDTIAICDRGAYEYP